MSVDVGALHAGEVFHGRYAVVRRIAAGGMGAVYEVIHQGTQRRCAMKLMLPSLVANADLRARFQTEATIAAKIGSEHIVDVFDAGVDEATKAPFLVMELLEGDELGSLLRKKGPLPAAETITLLHQASLALGRTHAAGIVHRDLKPENMFVTRRDDGSPRLKILDFGIARVVAESGQASQHTGMLGTPAYMAPEQVHAKAPLSPAADVFAIAQVAYTMLVGELYWEEEAVLGVYPLIAKIMAGPSEPPAARARRRKGIVLPEGFDAWFARATAPSPAERYQRTAEEVAALAAVFGIPLPGAPMSPAQATPPRTLASPVQQPPLDSGTPMSSTLPQPGAGALRTVPMGPLGGQSTAASVGPDFSPGPLVIPSPRASGDGTQVSGPNGPAPRGTTTTMPVSSDPITRRIERSPTRRPALPFVIGGVAALVLAIGLWLAVRGGTPAAGSANASPGENPAVSAPVRSSASPASNGAALPPATVIATSTATEAPTASTTASASSPSPSPSPVRVPGGKVRPKPPGTTHNPLDDGP